MLGALLLALLLVAPTVVLARAPENPATHTARLMETLRASPPRLRMFLRAMPKGGDLHHHLSGAVYAEDFLDEAGKAGFCVAKDGTAILRPPCDPAAATPAADLIRRDPALYAKAVDGLSMRGFVAGATASAQAGHDRFFATFQRFGAIGQQAPGRMLAEARRLAAGDHVSYLETQHDTLASTVAAQRAVDLGVPADDPAAAYALIAADLPTLIAESRGETDRLEQDVATRLGCAQPAPPPACAVTVRFQAFAVRSLPPQAVFGQLALAFALADADPRYVGVNIVAPEDGPVALADYDRHMAMLRFLSRRYPNVPMSLHAGELSLGLVPPAALRDHIAKAVAAGARRIGHGVDISYEADAPATLARMAREHVAVEINLTSNDTILGVRGADHPLGLYRAAGVPVLLSTDDEGVSRSDMTAEYLRAVTEQGLGYADLKAMARASVHYGFLRGESLWRSDGIGIPASACHAAAAPSPACAALLQRSDKARAEWRLEAEFAAFETAVAEPTVPTPE